MRSDCPCAPARGLQDRRKEVSEFTGILRLQRESKKDFPVFFYVSDFCGFGENFSIRTMSTPVEMSLSRLRIGSAKLITGPKAGIITFIFLVAVSYVVFRITR
jgi:hypothetical protein